MKKLLRLFTLVLALTLALGTAAAAEEAVLLWEADSISNLSTATDAVKVLIYNQGYGIATLDGQLLLPCQYSSISDVECMPGYYTVSVNDSINSDALIDSNSRTLTEDTYGDIKMLSEDWFIGVVLEATTGEDYDYRSFWGSGNYLITRCDIYYTPTGKVGSLTRAQYRDATAHGDYLLVQARDGSLQAYDKNFMPVSSAFNSYYNGTYYIESSGLTKYVTHRVTGERIASGYSDVSSSVFNGEVLEVYSSTAGGRGLIDMEGNVLIPCAYGTYFYECSDTRYIKVQQNGLYGLYDLEKRAFVLPCEYTDILKPDYDTLNYSGYFLVEKDGKVGYVDENGNVTCSITYAKSAVTPMGCSMYAADLDGTYKLIAADGRITPLAGVTEIEPYATPAHGRYLVVKNAEGLWGIIDWHGNLVVEHCVSGYYSLDFVDETHFVFESKSMYEIK